MSDAFSVLRWLVVFLFWGGLVASACCFFARRRAQWDKAQLSALQIKHLGLIRLLDSWYWQTDNQHRLTESIPPRGLSPQANLPAGLLWDWLQCPEGSLLQARVQTHQDLHDVVVHAVGRQAPSGALILSASALRDPQGVFNGYAGILRLVGHLANHPEGGPPEAQSEQASFSYLVSHDLRAPIRVVEGFARILKEDYGRVLDRVGNDHLGRILSAAARMNRMIDSLLTLSQLSCTPLQNEAVNLSEIGALVIDELRRQSSDRDVKVYIEPGMLVQGDPVLLRIAIENLLGNAWKYTGKTPNAMISFSHPAQSLDFLIRDNGAGFDMRFVDRLFGVFQRLHGANDFQGTGVGLASVRRIIRRHGGNIWAHGVVNQGAEFFFSLPTLPGPKSQAPVAPSANADPPTCSLYVD